MRDWGDIDLRARLVGHSYFLEDETVGRSYRREMIRKVTVLESYDTSFEAIDHMDHYLCVALMGTYDCNFLEDCLGKSFHRRYQTLKSGASQVIPLEIAVLC